jgi:hypothetical protein
MNSSQAESAFGVLVIIQNLCRSSKLISESLYNDGVMDDILQYILFDSSLLSMEMSPQDYALQRESFKIMTIFLEYGISNQILDQVSRKSSTIEKSLLLS